MGNVHSEGHRRFRSAIVMRREFGVVPVGLDNLISPAAKVFDECRPRSAVHAFTGHVEFKELDSQVVAGRVATGSGDLDRLAKRDLGQYFVFVAAVRKACLRK